MEIQARRLLRAGIALFLLAALLGLAISHFTVPRVALSAHLVGILQGMFLVVAGLLWTKLSLRPAQAGIALWLLVYQGVAAPLSILLAAAWGGGSAVIPLAAGTAHAGPIREAIVNVGLRSAGAALIVALVLVLWGLRGERTAPDHVPRGD